MLKRERRLKIGGERKDWPYEKQWDGKGKEAIDRRPAFLYFITLQTLLQQEWQNIEKGRIIKGSVLDFECLQ